MEINVYIKSVYGTKRYYPACFNAGLFSRIAQKPTLTEVNLKLIKELGFKINVVAEELDLP